MISPAWLAYLLAGVVIAVALFSAIRLIAARGQRRRCEVDADGMHVVMGVAMAGMFVPQLATLPDGMWTVLFAAGAGWFGWRAVRVRRLAVAGAAGAPAAGLARPGIGRDCCPYPVPHLIDCLAMVYALVAVPAIVATSAPQASGSGPGGMSVMSHGGDEMAMGAGARLPVIGLILAICVCGYVVWLADRIQRFAAVPADPVVPDAAVPAAGAAAAGTAPAGTAPAGTAPAGTPVASTPVAPARSADLPATHAPAALLAPRAATCCKIAMGVAMGVMLIDLL